MKTNQIKEKRHKCYICERTRSESKMLRLGHIGNGYYWICKDYNCNLSLG